MEKQNDKLVFGLLETLGGILLAICLALSAWCLKEIYSHSDRITRVEAKQDGMLQTLLEIKADLKEIKHDLKSKP